MKIITRYLPLALLTIGMGTACSKFVDVTNPDTLTDPGFWKNENNVRSYCWEFYDAFPGFGNGSSLNGDFYFPALTDDQTPASFTQFPQTTAANQADWGTGISSTTFVSFGYVRKANILLERIEGIDMPDEAKNHWKGVARFFRALEYFKMVQEFGAVPWYGHTMDVSDSLDLYKPRDPRAVVMDSVLGDINYAVANLRQTDQPNTVTKDVALALKSRICLYEGTYRKYHTELNLPNADTWLSQAKDAAQTLISEGTYSLAASYQTAYNSDDLSKDKEMILYKQYQTGVLSHSLIAYLYSSTAMNGPSKSAVESYLCTDGKPIGLSPLYQGDATLQNVMANRDKRLYITVDSAHLCYTGHVYTVFSSSTGYRPIKFLPDSNTLKTIQTTINTNVTDAPLFWLAEVYLNYIEAAAELEDMGKYTLTQADLDNTVNKLRARGGVAPLTLTYLHDPTMADPKKDADVSSTIWEIRRERRTELMMDGFRFQDCMRWKKGSYLDSQKNPDSFLGAKVPANGSVRLNANGYIQPYPTTSQRAFVDPKNYLSAIPTNQILLYPASIQAGMQNPGW